MTTSARLTVRTCEACRLAGDVGLDVAAVAAKLGLGWDILVRAVRDYGRPLIDNPDRTQEWVRSR